MDFVFDQPARAGMRRVFEELALALAMLLAAFALVWQIL
jgi:ferric-dicitrate binding protein FerR (iron transport regulator)